MSSGVETRAVYKNNILASLSRAEIGRLAPHLSFLDLAVNHTLQEPNEEVTHAYFLESGLASVVVEMADGNTVETGITGKKGSWDFYIAGHQQHAHADVHPDSSYRLQNQSEAAERRI